MNKRANPMAVKAVLTYEVNEAAAALGKTPATIRNWIKDGLPVMSSRKPYLLLGADIRSYLRDKYRKAKTQLFPNQLYCLSCRVGRMPKDGSVALGSVSSKTLLLKGTCSTCGSTCTRMISKVAAPVFKETFGIS